MLEPAQFQACVTSLIITLRRRTGFILAHACVRVESIHVEFTSDDAERLDPKVRLHAGSGTLSKYERHGGRAARALTRHSYE